MHYQEFTPAMIQKHKWKVDSHTPRDFLIVKPLNNKLALFESESIIGKLNLQVEKVEVENENLSTEEIPLESLEDLLDSIPTRLPVSYVVKVTESEDVKAVERKRLSLTNEGSVF